MNEPLEIEIDGYTFHVIVTGWPSRGGATSPPYGAEWHLGKILCHGVLVWAAVEVPGYFAKGVSTPPWTANGLIKVNDRVQEAVADWADAEDQRR